MIYILVLCVFAFNSFMFVIMQKQIGELALKCDRLTRQLVSPDEVEEPDDAKRKAAEKSEREFSEGVANILSYDLEKLSKRGDK